jgi:hypothetical protein
MASEQAEVAYSPQNEAYRAYDLFESRGSADELSKLADLRDRGVITYAEFQKGKTPATGLTDTRTDTGSAWPPPGPRISSRRPRARRARGLHDRYPRPSGMTGDVRAWGLRTGTGRPGA